MDMVFWVLVAAGIGVVWWKWQAISDWIGPVDPDDEDDIP